VSAPHPGKLARQLRQLAQVLDDHGERAVELAPVLAARGFPASTIGAPGGRGNAELTSTEAAADRPAPFDNVDRDLDRWLELAFRVSAHGQDLITRITAHAALDTEHQGRATASAGAGHCLACELWVPGTNNDRLRAGFCNACRVAFQRWRQTRPTGERAAFIRWRQGRTEPEVDGHGGHGA
jgi:hypothetical protein